MISRGLKSIVFLTLILFTTSCISYSPLPYDYKSSNTIDGTYSNDPIKNPFGDRKLWDFIHYKSSIKEDGLNVSLKLIDKNRILAKLLDGDSVIAEKDFKIKLREDSCYYTRRKSYIVPILPILWFYSDSQKRFIIGEESLILERTDSNGGAALIMAGGDNQNDSWEYEKL